MKSFTLCAANQLIQPIHHLFAATCSSSLLPPSQKLDPHFASSYWSTFSRSEVFDGLPMECLVDFGLLNTNSGGLTSKRCKSVFQRFAGSIWKLALEHIWTWNAFQAAESRVHPSFSTSQISRRSSDAWSRYRSCCPCRQQQDRADNRPRKLLWPLLR